MPLLRHFASFPTSHRLFAMSRRRPPAGVMPAGHPSLAGLWLTRQVTYAPLFLVLAPTLLVFALLFSLWWWWALLSAFLTADDLVLYHRRVAIDIPLSVLVFLVFCSLVFVLMMGSSARTFLTAADLVLCCR
jgi:Na+-translocating ferredoxin:NAD+ oxidoreductase RnfD subunit